MVSPCVGADRGQRALLSLFAAASRFFGFSGHFWPSAVHDVCMYHTVYHTVHTVARQKSPSGQKTDDS